MYLTLLFAGGAGSCRFHFLTRKDNPDGNSSSNSDQPKHILRLTREDASQVQFLL
ncbi:hypothetical protein PC117_g22567 [Phytophthora cactorum]|uniref:Uncharacterized protein n=1 Tax=Phytophthora cactorum TaxID=29920 RepID=A0A8T1BE38_9STRA|nr:hypothetical protein PC117_g22567 [Phytophthora cactorum]